MKSKREFLLLLLVVALLSCSSCQRYMQVNEIVNADSSYFSVKQYAADQIQMFAGVPHSLYRITYLDGQVDTTVANFMDMDWSPILHAFAETDIAQRKMLGKYDFNVYDDETTGSRGMIYTAKSPETLTRTLQINTDPSNNRITSIYIETAKHGFFSSGTRKMLYIPMRVIQIQERRHSLFGKAQDLRVDYRFMREDEAE